jgi:hypothetical protein
VYNIFVDPINPIAGNPEALNPTPVVPQPPKDNHWITIVSMTLFVLMSLGVIVFLYYQNQQLKSMLATYQTQPSPIPTATADPIANWKTFTNTKYSYSFKYPTNFTVNTEGNSDPTTANGILIADDCNYNLGQRCLQGFIDTTTPFKRDNKLSDYFVYAPGQTPTLLSEKQITIDNETALAREIYDNNHYYSSTEKGMVDYDIYVVHSGTVFALTFREEGKDQAQIKSIQDWQKKMIVDQILSTFKFLGTASPGSPVPTQKACTLEAKVCPDGSSVGRTGPNCEFAPCPTP